MICRVVIIDNGNQVSLTQQGEATPNFTVDGEFEPSDKVIDVMTDALYKLREVKDVRNNTDG